jgi:hypothetical protein
MADRQAKLDALMRVGESQESLDEAEKRLEAVEKTVGLIQERLEDWDGEGKDSLAAAAKELMERLGELKKEISLPEGTVGIVDDGSLSAELGSVYGSLESSPDRPTQAQTVALERAERRMTRFMEELDAFFAEDVPAFHEEMEEAGFELLGG